MNLDATTSLHYVELIVVMGLLVSSLEILQIRYALRDEGLLSWRVHRLSHPTVAAFTKKLGLTSLLRYPGVLILIGLRIGGAAAVAALALTNRPTYVPLLLTLAVNLVMTLRSPQGNDGSDQMASVILVAVTLSEVLATDFAKSAALIFVAAQAALAYGTSGFLKAKVAGWYDGSFVVEILKTSSFGNKRLLQYLEAKQYLARLLGLGVVYGDCSLALAALLPPRLCIILLSFGVMLHIGIALILGLNTFLWSFVATYPAILWVSNLLYRHAWK